MPKRKEGSIPRYRADMGELQAIMDSAIGEGKILLFDITRHLEKLSCNIMQCQTILIRSIHGVEIGYVKWRVPWKKYVYYPRDMTIYDNTFMKAIMAIIDKLEETRNAVAPETFDKPTLCLPCVNVLKMSSDDLARFIAPRGVK